MIEALQQHYKIRESKLGSDQRERAWDTFLALGLPTQRHERWRYTSLRTLQTLGAPILTQTSMNVAASLPHYAAKIVIIDGSYDPEQSEILHTGITVSTGDFVAHIDSVKHPLAHLSQALMLKSLTITVGANQVIKDPIEIVIVASKAAYAASFHMNHHIVLEKSAKATILVRYQSASVERYWCNLSRHLFIKEGASLALNLLQEQHESAVHTEVNHSEPGRDASVKICALSLGAKLARFDIDVDYQSTGAQSTMVGGYHVNGSQVVDYHMNATHEVGHCSTEQYVQGIADGKSRAIFNGRVKIDKNAAKSCSLQTNHNLLLSDRAEIDTKPELEIDHDDVQCKHGATVGDLDHEALFYLQSRGLSLAQAKALLQAAFMHQVIDKVDDESIRRVMTQAMLARWPEAMV